MKYKFLNLVSFFALVTTIFTSCIKDPVQDAGSQGRTFIKFLEAPEHTLYFTPFSNLDTVDLFSARKDAASNADLNTATMVTLTSMPQMIDSFNSDNGTSYELLPDSIFTLVNSSYAKTATGYTVNFAAGDFASNFAIALNGAKWDVAHTYAVAFSLAATGDNTIASSALDTIIVFLSVKNKYDGLYSLRINTVGWGAYGIADGVTYAYGSDVGFITSGPNTNTWDIPSQLAFTTDGGATGFGATQPQFKFDLATDKLIDVQNLVPDDGRARAFAINPQVTDSRYDPDKKIIYAAYLMTQTGRPTQYIYDTLTYKGPR